MDYFLELLMGGLTRGSIYALIALGYTMVYGIIELINFAHGEIYMIGAFTALIVSSVLAFYGFSGPSVLILAFVVAVFYAAAYGFTVEKIAYKPLRQAPRLSPLISAIGMSIFLQNYVMVAQTSDFLPFPNLLPDWAFLNGLGIAGPLGIRNHRNNGHHDGPADHPREVHPAWQGNAGNGSRPDHGPARRG